MYGFNNNVAHRYNKISNKWKKNIKSFNPGNSFYNNFGCKINNVNNNIVNEFYGVEPIQTIKNNFLQISKLPTQKRVTTTEPRKKIVSDRKIAFFKIIPTRNIPSLPNTSSIPNVTQQKFYKKPALPNFRIGKKLKSIKVKSDLIDLKKTEVSEKIVESCQNLKLIQMDVF